MSVVATSVPGSSRPGPAHASALLATALGLPLHLQRTSLIVWSLGIAIAVTALLAAWLPRAATGIAWGVYGALVLLAALGDVLGIPHDVVQATPFWAIPQPGRPDASWTAAWVMAVCACGLGALALWRYRTRNLTPA